ncbi:MAG: hypothetical protein U5K69_07870 [Balneolaceae bacterium]|nr:hypothetical protein [Balneolaceae bacterium]
MDISRGTRKSRELGSNFDEEIVKEHLEEDAEFFAPTPEWG